MEDFRITYREVGFALIVFNVVIAILFGSLPLIAGLMLKRQKLARIGFAVAVVIGTALGPIAAYIVAAIFLWLIIRRQTATSDAVEADGETSETPGA